MLWSEETQGDPLAMPVYALATIPLVDQLSDIQDVIERGMLTMPPLLAA